MAERHDYAYPFRIDSESRQARRASYEAHVMQMVRQVLLTTPGERANLPEFGCGLRAMIFAGNSDTLAAATDMIVRQALARWLSEHLTVERVTAIPEDSTLTVTVEYRLVATLAAQRAEVEVR